jgi:Uma2 family endonuclease
MGHALLKKQFYSSEEYLEMEESAEYKSEYYDGEIFAMSGGTYRHSAICINLYRNIGNWLESGKCRLFDSNLKLAIPKINAFVYPDLMVVCGKIEFAENRKDIISNPVLIAEVLSASTESFDRGKKFEFYRRLPSFKEYVLVSQDEPVVEVYFMQDEKKWSYSVAKGLEQRIILQSIEYEIKLKDIYQKTE